MNLFNTLREKKDHLIKKLDLTDSQKEEIIEFFNRRPDLENKVDWNNKNLDYEFFQSFIDEANKQTTGGNLKKFGLGTFTEGKDYFDISINNNTQAIVPLNYKFQNFIQNKEYLDCEAKWCIGYQHNDFHWNNYSKDSDFIIFGDLKNKQKFACQIKQDELTFWDMADEECCYNKYTQRIHFFDSFSSEIEREFFQSVFGDINKYLTKFLKVIENEECPVLVDYKVGSNGENEIEYLTPLKRRNAYNKDKVFKVVYPSSFNLIHPKTLKILDLHDVDEIYDLEKILEIYKDNLEKVVFPKNLKSVDCEGFINVKEIVLPKDTVSVGKDSFKGCEKLKSLVLPEKCNQFGGDLFEGCTSLEEISILTQDFQPSMQSASFYTSILKSNIKRIKAYKKTLEELRFELSKSKQSNRIEFIEL